MTRRHSHRPRFVALWMIIMLAFAPSLFALNVATHRLINEQAADLSSLDAFLKQNMGMPAGLQTPLKRDRIRSVREWLAEGGEREDDGGLRNGRFYNHFHNPLKPWAEGGLTFRGPNASSVQWMQDPGQGWGWNDARTFYRRALTASDARTREAAAADLFRALGQIMHLVVDASVPEHTRDDAHPLGSVLDFLGFRAGNYEYWVSEEQARLGDEGFIAQYLSHPIGFDQGILQIPAPAGESVATVPIGRLIDTDRYEYSGPFPPDPNVTLGGAIGLAEFSNANFFSENTLNGSFPFPRLQGLTPTPQQAPHSSLVRAYLAKPAGQGLPTTVALAECVSHYGDENQVDISSPYPCVDEAVWKETARHMLPRAVGYARGVLDYFFRGKLGVYFWTWVLDPPGSALIYFVNESGESMSGSFELYAGGESEHRQRASALFITDSWTLYGSQTFTLAPGQLVLLLIDPPPAGVKDLTVVFQGQLGLEENAVASGTIVLP